jgi:hypothetical protein
MVLSSSEWKRRAAARTDQAAARYRCEEGCGTMDQTPDHRSETAGPNRSKRSVVRVEVDRSKEIIERRVPGIVTSKGGEKSLNRPSGCVWNELIGDMLGSGKSLFRKEKGQGRAMFAVDSGRGGWKSSIRQRCFGTARENDRLPRWAWLTARASMLAAGGPVLWS